MSQQIYINGEYFGRDDAKVSVFDHGLLYGDGVFEGMRIYGGKVFRLREHLKRLWDSAQAIALTIPISMDQMILDVNATVAKNDLENGYIRLVVTRGAGPLGLDPFRCSHPQIIIIADTIKLYPEEFYQDGLELVTASTIRNHPAALSPRIKSLNYLNNIMAKIEGLKAGCVEALMLNHKGEVAECTGDNLFLVRDGVLITPPVDAGILEGITRDVVLELAAQEKIEVREIAITRYDVYVADECFLTGSAAEVIPAVKIDDRTIGDGTPGPITRKLTAAFRKLVGQ
ncbi:branched-chain-amino-acid transaminase [Novipirellula artificiosorum]|uniref:Branched-chain-amino-acid aminotransferase n=1 Tax=Novipirellula artificiosorum TaxID=2528016 RepID=A0A5C6E2T0_9BACT|nr:branched-chain-amino-acid transaminase [Novipirellula artificiosorum]TWU41921.1 Branched-chain-amino-acid aminotransferase [Novipirellula artificiosorum]